MTDDDTRDTLPGRLPVRTERRQLMRYDPTINSGHILQVLVLMLGGAGFYGTYAADKRQTDLEVAQVKRDAEAQRAVVKEALGDLKTDVKDIQRTLIDVSQSIAVLKARPDQPQPQPQQPRR